MQERVTKVVFLVNKKNGGNLPIVSISLDDDSAARCRSHHAKTCLLAYGDSEGLDQPAHPRSLIKAFAVRKQNH